MPPPHGPQIAKDVNVLTYPKKYCPLFFLFVPKIMSPVSSGVYDTLVPLDLRAGSPGPHKIGNKCLKLLSG